MRAVKARLATPSWDKKLARIDYGLQSIPVGGTGQKIEQVLDVQVDLPSTGVFWRPCYDARQLAADCLGWRDGVGQFA
jgi:hypothetical protein